jgi:hypothetical protein
MHNKGIAKYIYQQFSTRSKLYCIKISNIEILGKASREYIFASLIKLTNSSMVHKLVLFYLTHKVGAWLKFFDL